MNTGALGTVGIDAFLAAVRHVRGSRFAAQCATIIEMSMQTAGPTELCVLSMINIMAILRQANAS